MAQALLLMDSVDVTVPDGGRAELKQLLDKVWVSDEERLRKRLQLAGQAVPSGSLALAGGFVHNAGELHGGNSDESKRLGAGNSHSKRRRKPSLHPVQESTNTPVP